MSLRNTIIYPGSVFHGIAGCACPDEADEGGRNSGSTLQGSVHN